MCSTFLLKLKNNIAFRIKLFLFLSLVFNFAYALFLLVVSQVYSSKWFFVMSVYYALLSTARIFIFSQMDCEKNLRKKISTMRACGFFLFLVNVAVSVMMMILSYMLSHVKYHEITVIALATYTFSSLTLAIISSIKHLKNNDYVYFCVNAISLISASVSMVTLTNTMLATFGDGNTLLRSIILPIISAVVSVFIIVCAVLMVKKANRDLRGLEK